MARSKVQKNSFSFPFFAVLLISVLILGFLIIFWSLTRPFCAASDNCKDAMKLSVTNGAVGIFNGQRVTPPVINLKEQPVKVLGEATMSGERHIYVDLTTQTLTAYQGDTLFLTASVSTGKWHPTPTGEFTIWEKLRSTRMSGGTGNDFYDLPNVPYVMFFSGSGVPAGDGFSLHGAYWHNNFGHPMSHGCVNMRTVDVQKLFDWVGDNKPATKITIYGQAPI
jgi:lipoprotein-anchoring transpeptidase ErfK/SrfK